MTAITITIELVCFVSILMTLLNYIVSFFVLPGPDTNSRPHSPKNHGHFRSFYGHLSKNLPPHDISKHNNNKKQKNLISGEGFCNFFISALHFWVKYYTNFLNLTKLVSLHLIATHGHFHCHQFLTANYLFYTTCFELFSGGHSHLATLNFLPWSLSSLNQSGNKGLGRHPQCIQIYFLQTRIG
jgi:hypothetical protein